MKTYLFDFDGTLVDSMPFYIGGILSELDKNNCKYGEDIIKIITPLGLFGTAEYFIKTFGLNIGMKSLLKLLKTIWLMTIFTVYLQKVML